MNMLRFALAPVLALTLAVPAFADKIPLATLSAYLNGLTTAQAKFTQVNSDGSLSTGTIYIRRPGRVRFEYNTDKTLVLASGGTVAVFDPKSNQPPQQYPLSRTPLNLILAANVDLGRSNMVVGHTSDDKTTTVVAQDPDHPDYGSISLVFTANPTELRQWTVTDDSGSKTVVILQNLQTGVDLPASLFSIDTETQKRRQ
ncbi:LolA family protein [Paenirhodobacter enshiensis]|uniref:Cell envelope biogenesis protein LolA n=1 Tax=Paenirhodobacter enshiensis TaxID=1105367 RepID=A0A086Y3H5_9RHOB|nr:outer membrane lipoprotein carrier protein LolA [Paenirhodobacter enshiensis]KFI28825.1 cell envelope biogenesis protein LolA [Paenirhodobacter enshiensis]